MEQKEELNIKEKSFKQGEAMASSSSSSFSQPPSLLRHVVNGFAGYLAGLFPSLQNLKSSGPAASVPKQEAQDNEAISTAPSSEEPVAVQMIRSRAMARPQGPLLREGNGGRGGAHHNVGV